MKKALLALLLALAPVSAHAADLGPLKTRYLDGLLAAKPHLATFMGDHRFDDKLVDLSDAATAARKTALTAQLGELRALDRTKLGADDRVDADIMEGAIGLELLYLTEIRDWTWDPRLHDSFPYYDPREIIAARLTDIVHGDYAPEADRRRAVTAQLKALPAFLKQAETLLGHVPKVYLDQALQDNKGRIEFFESDVKVFTKADKAAESARTDAVKALRGYQTFLEKTLPARADRDWRLGPDVYNKKFPLALETKLTPGQACERAETVFTRARAELYQLASSLWQKQHPGAPAPNPKAEPLEQARVINQVKDELSKQHAKPDNLVAAHARNLDAMRAFIQKHDLVELPAKETLLVEPMPVFKRGSSAAEYLAPGVLDRRPTWHATYYVDPIHPRWPADKVESYLRGQNDYEVQLVAIHEAYPGHHVQYAYSKRNLNPLRAVLWNAPMVEGWAVYGEGRMVDAGYGGADNDRFRFYDLRGQMIVATNMLMDVKLQRGQMSDQEAVRFMVEEGFQEQAMAEKKLLRAKLDSTQLAQYFLGLEEIRALEADYRRKVGDAAFKQRTFNEAVIGHGSIAVKYLRRYLLGE